MCDYQTLQCLSVACCGISCHVFSEMEDNFKPLFVQVSVIWPFTKPRLLLQIRLRLAWPRGLLNNERVLCVRVQGFGQEDGA